jgi:hypothetical protein
MRLLKQFKTYMSWIWLSYKQQLQLKVSFLIGTNWISFGRDANMVAAVGCFTRVILTIEIEEILVDGHEK